jgi:hypothetical protein
MKFTLKFPKATKKRINNTVTKGATLKYFFFQYWNLNSGPELARQVFYHLSHALILKDSYLLLEKVKGCELVLFEICYNFMRKFAEFYSNSIFNR